MKNKASPHTISEIVTYLDCIFELVDVGIEGIEYYEEAEIIRIRTEDKWLSRTIDTAEKNDAQVLNAILLHLPSCLNTRIYD